MAEKRTLKVKLTSSSAFFSKPVKISRPLDKDFHIR